MRLGLDEVEDFTVVVVRDDVPSNQKYNDMVEISRNTLKDVRNRRPSCWPVPGDSCVRCSLSQRMV